jgi:hypothetical protein
MNYGWHLPDDPCSEVVPAVSAADLRHPGPGQEAGPQAAVLIEYNENPTCSSEKACSSSLMARNLTPCGILEIAALATSAKELLSAASFWKAL